MVAQTLALEHPHCVNKLILLSTDSGGADADLASADVWSQLVDYPARRMSRLVACSRCFLRAMLPNPSIGSSAISWRLRARGYLLSWSTVRLRPWTHDITLVC